MAMVACADADADADPGAGAAGSSSSSHCHKVIYPSPLLTHDEVSANPMAFLYCIRKFHSAMGTTFTVPAIEGKELSLHQLYVQVTRRGGLEKVIIDDAWGEVLATFDFPAPTASTSILLRKNYLNLLYHFEQVYFFRYHGPIITLSEKLRIRTMRELDQGRHSSVCKSPRKMKMKSKRKTDMLMSSTGGSVACGSAQQRTAASQSKATTVAQSVPLNGDGNGVVASGSVPIAPITGESSQTGSVACDSAQQRTAASQSKATTGEKTSPLSVAQSVPLNGDGNGVAASGSVPFAPISGESSQTGTTNNYTVTGTIDGKFEHGYFISVKNGSQILHGVLYHVHPVAASYSALNEAGHQPQAAPSSSAPASLTDIIPRIPLTRSVSRRRKRRHRHHSLPKPNRSGYNFFFAEKHSVLRVLYPNRNREYSRMIGESWNKLSEEERKVYEDYGRWDKERYKREMQEYSERMKLDPSINSETARSNMQLGNS